MFHLVSFLVSNGVSCILRIQIGKRLCFHIFCRIGVDIHCRADISMSHNILNYLDVHTLFAHSRGKGMSEGMSTVVLHIADF